jgi:dTDP-4-amino-4,6-dideoxygalactose transaminase
MWSRKRIDIAWSDLLFGVWQICFPPSRAQIAHRVERLWPDPEHTLICLSVRSGFDLLLATLALPCGSEVLVSAITIPDMIRIIEHHGLVPVPVDLDPQQMSPTDDAWQGAVTPATRAILVAYLFGGRANIEPLLELARQHNLFVIEDCAQAFAGMEYQGHPDVDASMFSFGMIKACTALGGAVLRIHNLKLLGRMRAIQKTYPIQSRWCYLKRLKQAIGFKTLACRPVCSLFVRICGAIGCNYDRLVNRAARGFSHDRLWLQIRQQPSMPLLAMLHRRLHNYNSLRGELHIAKGKALAALFQDVVDCPGTAVVPHTYWVFPVLVEEPARLIKHLISAGFDATQGHSLCVVQPPKNRREQRTFVAENILAKVVFLPFYPELPLPESERMAAIALERQLAQAERSHSNPT